jgi:pimeloyl-ACP methyl ester carboxylesterase
MTTAPETHYAKSGDISIAYQVVGSGPVDLIVVPGFISHLDLQWQQDSAYRAWVQRLASFCRVILFDKRGSGLSDRDVGDSALEERMDDLRAVMDAAGSERASVLGFSEGGPLAMLLAATYPKRVRSLILCGTFATFAESPDFPGPAKVRHLIETAWGEGRTLEVFAPSLADLPGTRTAVARLERACLSPKAARIHFSWITDIDVRPVALALQVPTLVFHRTTDSTIPVDSGRWLAQNIPNARYVEQEEGDHVCWYGDAKSLLDEIQQFLTGSRGEIDVDRVLAAVLFTDIAGSTDHLARLGDRRWGELLGLHHQIIRDQLSVFRGHEVDTAGDGFLATFDGPARAVRCAMAAREAVQSLGIDIRAGCTLGNVSAG